MSIPPKPADGTLPSPVTTDVTPPAPASDETRRAAARDRKRTQRARAADPGATTVDSRPGRMPGPKLGNPLRFGPAEGLGDPISPSEATRNLKAAHVSLAKIVRSQVNLNGLDEEFTTAGQAYSDVANHMVPWLRILPRLIAPLVLAGALIAIWGAILLDTPWVQRWTERRRLERAAREQEAQLQAQQAPGPPPTPVPPPAPVYTSAAPAGEPEPAPHPPMPQLVRGALRKMG